MDSSLASTVALAPSVTLFSFSSGVRPAGEGRGQGAGDREQAGWVGQPRRLPAAAQARAGLCPSTQARRAAGSARNEERRQRRRRCQRRRRERRQRERRPALTDELADVVCDLGHGAGVVGGLRGGGGLLPARAGSRAGGAAWSAANRRNGGGAGGAGGCCSAPNGLNLVGWRPGRRAQRLPAAGGPPWRPGARFPASFGQACVWRPPEQLCARSACPPALQAPGSVPG